MHTRALVCAVSSVLSDSLWPMDYTPPGSSVHGILQAKILGWVAMLSSWGSSWPRDWTHVSYGSCTLTYTIHILRRWLWAFVRIKYILKYINVAQGRYRYKCGCHTHTHIYLRLLFLLAILIPAVTHPAEHFTRYTLYKLNRITIASLWKTSWVFW